MKRLYLARHGKSDWSDPALNDLERVLKKRGIMNCEEMATQLKEDGLIPDLIISSPAVRAYESARIYAGIFGTDSAHFKTDEKLYLPEFSTLLKLLLYIHDEYSSVMLVGHEPSISHLINHFIAKPVEHVSTSSVTILDFKALHWMDLSPANIMKALYKSRHNLSGLRLL